MDLKSLELPEKLYTALRKAITILKSEGCSEIYVFGSVAEKSFHDNSDIDIAVKGMPPKKYFKLLGLLELNSDVSIDLISLDEDDNRFVCMIKAKGELIRVA